MLFTNTTRAQFVTIPDQNFVGWLNDNGFSQCLSGNQLDTTCPAVLNATSIIINPYYQPFNYFITDLTGVQYFPILDTLIARNAWVDTVVLPATLTYLDLSGNNLPGSAFNPLPPNLITLMLDARQRFDTIHMPAIPSSVLYFSCSYCGIDSVTQLPDSLLTLDLSNNMIPAFPALPVGLQEFRCSYTNVTSLPALPQTLTYLDCTYDNLVTLPTIPASLLTLICGDSVLTVLPALPVGLNTLAVSYTKFTDLGITLPPNLHGLRCDYNLLDTLPGLPASLTALSCAYNHLTKLPTLTGCPGLSDITCSYNDLRSMPQLPNVLSWFSCDDNPNLTCLPRLPDALSHFYFQNTGITCLPNYPGYSLRVSNPSLNSYPICGTGNANACPGIFNIEGQVYLDSIANCVFDAGEETCINVPVSLYKNGVQQQRALTHYAGTYSFTTPVQGVYTVSVDTAFLPFTVTCPANNMLTDTIAGVDTVRSDQNFGVICPANYDIAAVSAIPQILVHGVTSTLNVVAGQSTYFYGVHCSGAGGGTVTLNIVGPISYLQPAPGAITPTTVIGNYIEWSVADFSAVNPTTDFNIIVQIDSGALYTDMVCVSLAVHSNIGADTNPNNDSIEHCFTVQSCFDPNYKSVYPDGDIDTTQRWLTYTIHFQNTGTAVAYNVHVDDTLNTNLFDIWSLQLLAYSTQPEVLIQNSGFVRFDFPNINLPDSGSNMAGSSGYVQFKVKLKDNVGIGAQINNTAGIYFDLNQAVLTNTTHNTVINHIILGTKQTETNLDVQLYPNPTTGILNVRTDGLTPELLCLYNLSGQKLNEQKYAPQIDISKLSSGIYFIEIKANGAVVRKKFVKM